MSYFIVPIAKEIELTELTSSIKKVVPQLEGMGRDPGVLVVRRLTGDFTDLEKSAILSEINSHDALAIRQAKKDKENLKKAELKKDPSTIPLMDRLRRVELFLGIDRAIE